MTKCRERYYVCPWCKVLSTGYHFNASIYNKSYASNYKSYEGNQKTDELNSIRYTWLKENAAQGSKVLDFGCSCGTFLADIENEYRTYGYDINPEALKMSSTKKSKLSSTLEEHMNEMYDSITMFDSIEHIEDPNAILQILTAHLNKNGTILISTPNLDLCDLYNVSKNWRHFKPREHIHLFKIESILRLLHSNDLSITTIDYRESIVRDTYPDNILCITATKD